MIDQQTRFTATDRTRTRRVLIVDDDTDFADALADTLMMKDYGVAVANNAAQAIGLCREFDPAVVLLDINLGGPSGLELIAPLHIGKPDLICVIMTAYAEIDMAIEAIQQGAYDFLRKPFRSEEIQSVLDRCFEKIDLELANRAAEDALKQGAEYIGAIMNNVADAVIAIDHRGTIESFNSAAERSFGYTAEEVIGRNVKMLMPEPYAGEHDSYLARYLETGEAQMLGQPAREVIGRRKNGAICQLELAISETRIGDQPKFIGVARDITARKETEAQLRQAQKMEAVGQLTGGVAHDFNNLLAVVLGNLDLTADILDDDDPAGELIDKAIGAAERGANLTQRLLAFSRKQALQPEVIDCGQIVDNMEDLLRRTLGETIDIETSANPDLWLCAADPSQLENSILNLAINARDAMPRGGKLTIEVANAKLDDDYAAAQADVEPGEYVMVAVSDTGTGIPPDELGRVFDPFFTTKQVGQGSGLGLSMVYGFAKQSGGHSVIYSEFGEGTTVKLYLPQTRDSRSSTPRETRAVEKLEGREESILVVEDDPDVRTLTITVLGNLGYSVLEAGTAAAALELLDRTPHIDLMLTDVVLPEGMHGPELANEARRRRPELRILYMSGYTENAIDHQQRLDPAAELVQKPFRKRDLAEKVRHALDRNQE